MYIVIIYLLDNNKGYKSKKIKEEFLMIRNKRRTVFLIILAIIVGLLPLNIVRAGITDGEGATNSKTTLELKETGTEEVSYDTNLEEYIAGKKTEWLNSLASDPDYKDEWLSLYVSSNGVYKYPVAIHTYFTGVTVENSNVILVGDLNNLTHNNVSGDIGNATYNYRLEYKEITVTKAENPNEIKNVNITLNAPIVGNKVLPTGWTGNDTENIVDDGTMEPDGYPTVTSSTDHVMVDGGYWITGAYTEGTEDWDNLFFGTFKADTYYYAEIAIATETGYTFADGLTITVNGQSPVEVFGIYNGNSTYFIAKVKATDNKEPTDTTTYEFLEGANQVYTIGIDETATFKLSPDFSLFENGGVVYVDGTEIDGYVASSGSTIITISKDFMSSLSVGEHTLRVAFNTGKSAETTFTVEKVEDDTEAAEVSNSPKTGDNIAIWISMIAVSIIGIVGTIIIIKKK